MKLLIHHFSTSLQLYSEMKTNRQIESMMQSYHWQVVSFTWQSHFDQTSGLRVLDGDMKWRPWAIMPHAEVYAFWPVNISNGDASWDKLTYWYLKFTLPQQFSIVKSWCLPQVLLWAICKVSRVTDFVEICILWVFWQEFLQWMDLRKLKPLC